MNMELKELDDYVANVLESAIITGDNYLLCDLFLSDGSHTDKLDAIFKKLGEDIYSFSEDLTDKEDLISNVLQILSDLIQAHGINESISTYLAKPLLFLIVDEKCSITNIKRAVHVFNLLLQNPSIISSIVYDESLEGSLQILGRKVPSVGDYECQALIFEALYRMTCEENRKFWVTVWFSDLQLQNMFLDLDPQKFESNCRTALNYINRNEKERRVFSYIAYTIKFGSMQLKQPPGCDFWIDFNYDTESISFYCSEISEEQSADDSGFWETILINSAAVKSCQTQIGNSKGTKELVLKLNCPCHSLITSSNVTNPSLESYKIIIEFWEIIDVHEHVEKIYGKEKLIADSCKKRKSSDVSDAIPIKDKSSNEQLISDSMSCKKRRSSNVSDAIPIGEKTSNEKLIADPVSCRKHKSSNVSHAIPITEKTSNDQYFNGSISHKKRRVFDVSEPIQIVENELKDNVLPTGQNQKTRKVSNTSEVIKLLSPEHNSTVKQKNFRKMSTSSEPILIDISEIDGGCSNKAEKELLTSSKEEDRLKNPPKKVRLYNLDKAPVYDVPHSKSTDENNLSKSNSNISNEDQTNILEKKEKCFQPLTSDAYKALYDNYTNNSPSPTNELDHQHTIKEKEAKLFKEYPESEEDFQQSGKRRKLATNKNEDNMQVDAPSAKHKSQSKRITDQTDSHNNRADLLSSKSLKKPRRAAVNAMKKNKKIFDTRSEVTFDKTDSVYNLDVSPKVPAQKSQKRINSKSIFQTDTETGSSEVSWINKNKSCRLFETPKKSYSELKKSKYKKRKLPVEIVPDFSSSLKSHSAKRKKIKHTGKTISIDSGSKSKSMGWSDLENYDLTIEKAAKRGSLSVMKSMESDFMSVSVSSMKLTNDKKSFQSGSKQNSSSNKNTLVSEALLVNKNEENIANKHEDNALEDHYDVNCVENDTNLQTFLNISNQHDPSMVLSSKDYNILGSSSTNAKLSSDNKSLCKKTHKNKEILATAVQSTLFTEKSKDMHILKHSKQEKSKHSEKVFEDSGIQVVEADTTDADNHLDDDETCGKSEMLERFLNSVADCYGNSEYSFPGNESGMYENDTENQAEHIFEDGGENLGYQVCEDEVPHQQHTISGEILKQKRSETEPKKHKACESLDPLSLVKRLKTYDTAAESINRCESITKDNRRSPMIHNLSAVSVDDLCSRHTVHSSVSKKSLKQIGSNDTKSFKHGRPNASASDLNKSHKSHLKHETPKSVKSVCDKKIYSKNSRGTTDSVFEMNYDKNWFEAIVFALSQDAGALTRRLLATVQKYVFEYSIKMKALRKSMITTISVLDGPLRETASENKLQKLLKECRLIRIQVEKSLRKMHVIGNEYFQAENRYYRTIKKKHIKASRKYICSMRLAEKIATKKLDENVILKTKNFLHKFWRMIDTA